MKNKMNSCFTAISLIFIILIAIEPSQSQSLNGVHVRKGVWGDPPNQYKFKNVPENIGFLTEFPLEQIKGEVEEVNLNSIVLDYWIYASISDAEMAMVERLDMSSLFLGNIIDYPLADGLIGDNCWHSIETTGSVAFIRNNVLIYITPKSNSQFDSKIIEQITRKIDSILIKAEKVTSSNEVPAPEIHSMNIISNFPQNMEDVIDVKVDAIDLKGKKLYFRKYATGYAIVSETGVLTISFNMNTDSSEYPNKAKVKIWVWNEDHIVASIEEYIPF